jgi:hypothetical protein
MIAGSTIIKACTCKSEYQDAEHGNGMRVHNVPMNKENRNPTCTICGEPPQSMRRLISHGKQHVKAIHG